MRSAARPEVTVVVVIGRTLSGELRFAPVEVVADSADLASGDHHVRASLKAKEMGITSVLTAMDEEFAREACAGLKILQEKLSQEVPRELELLLDVFTAPLSAANMPRPRHG
jgi:hypothetical protein